MPHSDRRFKSSLIDRLFAEPYRFQYAQAVRVLELWLRRVGGADGIGLQRLIRFRNSTSLAFPASELEALEVDGANSSAPAELLAALSSDTECAVWLTPTFIGGSMRRTVMRPVLFST
jgi:type VI secretion system protein ImpH